MIRFGSFELWPESRRLLKDGAPLSVGARAFDVLAALVERCDRIVAREELLDAAWPGAVVAVNDLPLQIGQLRGLLGPDAIAPIPGRGHRFTAAVANGTHTDEVRVVASAPPPARLQRIVWSPSCGRAWASNPGRPKATAPRRACCARRGGWC